MIYSKEAKKILHNKPVKVFGDLVISIAKKRNYNAKRRKSLFLLASLLLRFFLGKMNIIRKRKQRQIKILKKNGRTKNVSFDISKRSFSLFIKDRVPELKKHIKIKNLCYS